ncbi:hypothetical protein PVL29_024573 [Vitis rotundifolia]|uniref:Uncharacterized protein n=1 Tax=Vitis rotundifolia TaxID=103349 RepID=A0AA38YS71_VITRO|nr:hypothetical protein PVL29_024573 [Vitis rotundifolia]
MHEGKLIDENMDEFTKLVLDLESLSVKIEDKNQAMILLNSLPKVFDQLRDTLKYSKDSLSFGRCSKCNSCKGDGHEG